VVAGIFPVRALWDKVKVLMCAVFLHPAGI